MRAILFYKPATRGRAACHPGRTPPSHAVFSLVDVKVGRRGRLFSAQGRM
jgi:hypothetical protein